MLSGCLTGSRARLASWQLQWPSLSRLMLALSNRFPAYYTNSTQSPIAIVSPFRSLQMKFVRRGVLCCSPPSRPRRPEPPCRPRRLCFGGGGGGGGDRVIHLPPAPPPPPRPDSRVIRGNRNPLHSQSRVARFTRSLPRDRTESDRTGTATNVSNVHGAAFVSASSASLSFEGSCLPSSWASLPGRS